MKKFIAILFFIMFTIMPANAINIGLLDNQTQFDIGSSQGAQVINEKNGEILYEIAPMEMYTLKAYKNTIGLFVNGVSYDLGGKQIVVKPLFNGFLCAKKRWYRGVFLVKNLDEKLVLINSLPIEEYLLGVVPSEMPSSWSPEALKAQAIVARSYAIANRGKHASLGYDLKDTTEDQAYGGATSEKATTNRAVIDTENIVITQDKKVIPAYYHASAGGHTLNSSDVWFKDLPFIKSVPSFDDNVKKNGHGIGMSQHGANYLAKEGYDAFQILDYFYKNINFGKLKPEIKL